MMRKLSKKLLPPNYEYQTQALRTAAQRFSILNMDLIDLAVELEKTARFVLKVGEAPFSKLGISRVGFFVLMCLSAEPSIHAVEIAKRWGVTKEAIGGVIQTLKKAGYVQQSDDLDDGRANIITLTDQGKHFFHSALNEYSNWLSEVFGKLNKSERERLMQFALITKNLFSD